MLVPRDLARELAVAVGLLVLVLSSIALTKHLYRVMRKAGLKHNVAVYYNRKIIHMMAGGVTALLVPYFFTSPLIPFIFALAIGLAVYIPHKRGRILEWFQVSDNMYEVNFCIAWGTSLLVLWLITGNPYIAVLPPLFISFGDAVTGVIRNAVYGERTKSWIGNIGMLTVTAFLGYLFGKYPGLTAGVIATLVEHFEIPPLLDDNLLIVAASSATLLLFHATGFAT